MAGTAAAMALKHIGNEVVNRHLSARERIRVGGTVAIASELIRSRIERGEQLRTDGFFDTIRAGRSDAEEVAESVLLRTQREPEERKIRHMALLLGNIAFDRDVSAHYAHQLVKAAETMTYRQLCIMKTAFIHDGNTLRSTDYRGQKSFVKSLYEILYECLDLYQRGFVNFSGEVAFGPTDIKPGSMRLQGMGLDLFNLMGLATIPQDDIDPVVATLSPPYSRRGLRGHFGRLIWGGRGG